MTVEVPIGGNRKGKVGKGRASPGADAPPTPRSLMIELKGRYWTRFHMFLIVATAISTAVLTTRLMLMAGVTQMWVRYLLALAFAYGMFFLGVWVWLHLSKYGRYLREDWRQGGDHGVGPDLPADLPLPSLQGGAPAELPFQGGGGTFDGGGAAGSWDVSPEPVSVELPGVSDVPGGEAVSKLADVGDLGDEGGCLLLIAGLLLVVALAAVFGTTLFVIYQAPAILAEVVFEVLLGSRLARGAYALDDARWWVVLFRKTWKPFTLMAAAAMAFALFCHWAFPDVATAGQVIQRMLG